MDIDRHQQYDHHLRDDQQDHHLDSHARKDYQNGSEADGSNSLELRPVFLGNLKSNYISSDVTDIFTKPIAPPGTPEGTYGPIPVDRVDLKRGYCFVFLKDAVSLAEKELAERFVSEINGM